MYNRIPNTAPPLLPMPDACKFHYDSRAGWASCGCRQFAVMYCQDKDTAKAIWSERHMNQDPEAA